MFGRKGRLARLARRAASERAPAADRRGQSVVEKPRLNGSSAGRQQRQVQRGQARRRPPPSKCQRHARSHGLCVYCAGVPLVHAAAGPSQFTPVLLHSSHAVHPLFATFLLSTPERRCCPACAPDGQGCDHSNNTMTPAAATTARRRFQLGDRVCCSKSVAQARPHEPTLPSFISLHHPLSGRLLLAPQTVALSAGALAR